MKFVIKNTHSNKFTTQIWNSNFNNNVASNYRPTSLQWPADQEEFYPFSSPLCTQNANIFIIHEAFWASPKKKS